VFEYASGGELYTRMKKQTKFSENVAKFYFCEISCAVDYLHNMSIVYRDLKPENIILDNCGHIKLCDFGFASALSSRDAVLNDGCGTAMYVAPEIASGHMKKAHGLPVDWWGLGCILYEMLTG
jgi:serine/threonine protein kinase